MLIFPERNKNGEGKLLPNCHHYKYNQDENDYSSLK